MIQLIEIKGFDVIQRELHEAQEAMEKMGSELGVVNFDPEDPISIELAVQDVNRLIDDRLGGCAQNPFIAPLIDSMKEKYREMILEKAASLRLSQGGEDERQ